MGGDFIFRRIAQDAFDPVALSDEVDESGVSSVKHRVARVLFSLGASRKGKPLRAGHVRHKTRLNRVGLLFTRRRSSEGDPNTRHLNGSRSPNVSKRR